MHYEYITTAKLLRSLLHVVLTMAVHPSKKMDNKNRVMMHKKRGFFIYCMIIASTMLFDASTIVGVKVDRFYKASHS